MKIFTKHSVFAIAILLLVSCNQQQAEDTNDKEQDFKEFRDFVTQTEDKANAEYTETELRAMQQSEQDSTAWQTETTELKQQYESKKKKVEDNLSSYDANQQEEYRDLDSRYNRAISTQKNKEQEVSRRYKLRNELLGLPVKADDMSNVTADELADVYQRFVKKLSDKSLEIKSTDWNLIEGWWLALNNRKNALDDNLSANARKSIEQATKDYQLMMENRPTQR
jgi:hypothetical protein